MITNSTWFFSKCAGRQDVVDGGEERKERYTGVMVRPFCEKIKGKDHFCDAADHVHR